MLQQWNQQRLWIDTFEASSDQDESHGNWHYVYIYVVGVSGLSKCTSRQTTIIIYRSIIYVHGKNDFKTFSNQSHVSSRYTSWNLHRISWNVHITCWIWWCSSCCILWQCTHPSSSSVSVYSSRSWEAYDTTSIQTMAGQMFSSVGFFCNADACQLGKSFQNNIDENVSQTCQNAQAVERNVIDDTTCARIQTANTFAIEFWTTSQGEWTTSFSNTVSETLHHR